MTVLEPTDSISMTQRDGASEPGFLRRVASCRLCWLVTAAVFVAILIIEAVLLAFSTGHYENARLRELERSGRAAWLGMIDSHGHDVGEARLLRAARGLAVGSVVVGGSIYRPDGSLIGSFGETPMTRLDGAVSAAGRPGEEREEEGRHEVLWPAEESEIGVSVIARLDSSGIRNDVRGFVSRVIGRVLLIAVFVTAATIIVLSRLVLAPMLYLRNRMLAAGCDIEHPRAHLLPDDRRDELGDVMRAFNAMLARLSENLTQLRRQEAQLEAANRDLEDKVAARTHELTTLNRQLASEIAERKIIEQEVAHLAKFPEENPSPVIRARADGGVLYANPPGVELLGDWGCGVGDPLPAPWNERVMEAARDKDRIEIDASCGQHTYSLMFQPVPDGGYVNIYGRDVTARKQAEERVLHLANHDTLTGLPNRALFHDRLQQALLQARRNGAKVAIHMLDLDHFKDVNDTLGHSAGDTLLVAVAERLKTCLRETDTVARLGGDEFAVIQIDAKEGIAYTVLAQKILDALSSPVNIDGSVIHPGGSIGITLFPDDAEDPDQLMRNADMALYEAKDGGRGGYQFFVHDLNESMMRRLEIEAQLHVAVEREEFVIHYQPKLRLGDGRIAGMEALIRWIHPEHGFQSPGEFIPVAERTKLILPIGRWVLR